MCASASVPLPRMHSSNQMSMSMCKQGQWHASLTRSHALLCRMEMSCASRVRHGQQVCMSHNMVPAVLAQEAAAGLRASVTHA